jgi:hypothetical protein
VAKKNETKPPAAAPAETRPAKKAEPCGVCGRAAATVVVTTTKPNVDGLGKPKAGEPETVQVRLLACESCGNTTADRARAMRRAVTVEKLN